MNRIARLAMATVLTLCGIVYAARCTAENPPVQILLSPPGEFPPELLDQIRIELEPSSIPAAVQQYLNEIDEIDKSAAEQKAQARVQLLVALAALEAAPRAAVQERYPGLVGGSTVNRADGRYVFEYQHALVPSRVGSSPRGSRLR